jgi:uncharacterized protein YwgA
MIEGRTRIQKEICLLKFKSKIPFTFNYRSYYYGPYSEELSETINMLVGVKLLKENMISVGYNTYRYDYSLTEQGEALFERICQKPNPLLGKIQKDVRKMEKIETPRLVSLAKAISGMESIC